MYKICSNVHGRTTEINDTQQYYTLWSITTKKKKKTCLKVLIFNVKGSTTRLRPISIMSIIIVLCTYILTAFKRKEVRVYSGTYDFSSIRCTPEFKTWKNLIAIRSLCRSRIPIASATCSWQFRPQFSRRKVNNM